MDLLSSLSSKTTTTTTSKTTTANTNNNVVDTKLNLEDKSDNFVDHSTNNLNSLDRKNLPKDSNDIIIIDHQETFENNLKENPKDFQKIDSSIDEDFDLTDLINEHKSLKTIQKSFFKKSGQESIEYKQVIGEKIQKIEYLIDRIKCTVFGECLALVESTASNSFIQHCDQQQFEPIEKISAFNTTVEKSKQNPVKMISSSASALSKSTTTIPRSNMVNIEELRSILTEIDRHLSTLKDVEQKHSMICENYAREIQSRDEILLSKIRQINTMSYELSSLQNKVANLSNKNQQLESEIKFFKISSISNTETSTPVNVMTNEAGSIHSDSGIQSEMMLPVTTCASTVNFNNAFGSNIVSNMMSQPLYQFQKHHGNVFQAANNKINYSNLSHENFASQQSSRASAAQYNYCLQHKTSIDEKYSSESSLNPVEIDYQAMYWDLLGQYKKIEHLINQSQVLRPDIDMSMHGMEKSDKIDNLHVNGSDSNFSETNNQNIKTDKSNQDDEFMSKSSNETDTKNQITFSLENGLDHSESPEKELDSPNITEGIDDHSDIEKIDQASLDINDRFEKSVTTKRVLNSVGEYEDVITTSVKAYEHFVKMQHDLEELMRKETDYRNKISEMEQENENLREKFEDSEFKLSEVQYELTILKHNYDLEMESFGTAVNERESLIEKLQQKMQSLKQRYIKLDGRFRTSIAKEVELNAEIQEFEGRLKYEQLQKETLIDSRVNDLEMSLEKQEQEYQIEINNLKTDLACRESIEKELKDKIEELEASLKALTTPEFEDEFFYYKNQIDNLVKELDKERQEKQRLIDQYEESIRSKDRQFEQIKEQTRKSKDAMLREKNDFEQKYKKTVSKIKIKEHEIEQLQTKIKILSEKFNSLQQKHQMKHGKSTSTTPIIEQDSPSSNRIDENSIWHQKQSENDFSNQNEEQLMAELALNHVKISEMQNKLDDYEDQLSQLQQINQQERERRRQLEAYYFNSVNNNGKINEISDLLDLYANSMNMNDSWSNYEDRGGLNHRDSSQYHRDSTTSLTLMMDCIKDDRLTANGLNKQSIWSPINRWLQRQKNIVLFGRWKQKFSRLTFLLYVLAIHYFALISFTEMGNSQNRPSAKIKFTN